MLKTMTFRCTLAAVACAISISAHAMADPAKQIDVPAGSRSAALESLEKQAAIELVFQPDQLKTFHTKGVKGMFQPEAAIKILLRGAPLEFRTDPAGAMVIALPHLSNDSTSSGETNAAQREDATKEDPSNGDVESKTFWEQFRLAQLDQGTSSVSSSSSSSKKKDSSDSATMETDNNNVKLGEVVVTAQKRQENQQTVPVSMQVISGQTLADQNHNSLQELAQIIPTLNIKTVVNSDSLYLRGIGSSGEGPQFDQSVSMFIDDIYHGRSRMSEGVFLDLDHIEVLKGPQSTYFGNNAIAGALNIVTKKPGDHFDAWGRLLYGQFGTYAAEGAVGGPITDMFGVRLSVTRNGDDEGWIHNTNTGDSAPRVNNEAARLTLVFNPSEALDATLKIEGSLHRVGGSFLETPGQWNNCPPPPPFTLSYTGPACAIALASGVPIGLNQNNTSGLAGAGSRLSTFEDVLTINYRKWGQTFTSVTGFNNYHYHQKVDDGLIPMWYETNVGAESYRQFSQELRVASPTGGPIEYLAGAYFQTDKDEFTTGTAIPFADNFGNPALTPYVPIALDGPNDAQTEHLYSLFGSLSWNVTDRFKLTGGLRGNWDKKTSNGDSTWATATQTYGGFVPLPPAALNIPPLQFVFPSGPSNAAISERALMPSARIQYQIDGDAMVYLSYNRGFLAGGVNLPGTEFSNNPTFGPEYVNAYEVGLKSKWFDDRLLLNLDVFRGDYKGLQTVQFINNPQTHTPIVETLNAGTARSQGVEFETQWVVTRDLRLSANVTYLEAYYVSFPNAVPTSLQQFCAINNADGTIPQCNSVFPNPVSPVANLSGQPTPNAPRWSGSVVASYSAPLPGGYKLTTQLSPYFTSSYSKDPQLDALRIGYLAGTSGYVRLDGRLTLARADSRWALDLIGKNLTNRVIISTAANFPTAEKEEPRNVALQLRYHF